MKIIYRFFKLPCLVVILLLTLNAVTAWGKSHNAEQFISDLGHRAITSLTEGTSSNKGEAFLALLDEGFDVSYIAGFVMGAAWRDFTPEQRELFCSLFRQRLKKTYVRRFKEYKGVVFNVESSRAEGAKHIVLTTIQKPGGPATPVEWTVAFKESNPKIQDVKVEGVSMSLTMRSEYRASYRQVGGTPRLFLKYLEDQVKDDPVS